MMRQTVMGRKTMTSKERVLAAFSRQVPDRVPVNYDANAGIDERLKSHFGLAKNDSEGLKKALGVDFRAAEPRYTGPKLHADMPERGVTADNWGVRRRWVQHETGGYWDYCDFPLKDATEEEIAAWPMPNPDDFDYSQVREHAQRFRDYAVFVGGPGQADVINKGGMLRGTEQCLVDLVSDDPAGLMLAKRRTGIQLEILARSMEAARGSIDFLWMGEDLGTQIGPLIGLDLYRRHIRPVHRKFVDLAKSFGLHVMIHTCGSSSWAFNDFAEIGISAVDTLQPEAKDMSPAHLKKTFGGRLAFHGCISTAGPLAFGTAADVIANCRETLEVMMPGGGYCFAPTHCLQDNSPTENVLAMYETAHEHGRYR